MVLSAWIWLMLSSCCFVVGEYLSELFPAEAGLGARQ